VGLSIFNRDTVGALTRALDAASLRQETVASNLANANTPGYQRRDVTFSLEGAERAGDLSLARTNARHLGAPGAASQPPVVVTDDSGAMRLDGNNVDPDAESVRLAQTEVTYAALTQALSSQFTGLRIVITGTK
jgi:flagellar basal-body rod protein FlgB